MRYLTGSFLVAMLLLGVLAMGSGASASSDAIVSMTERLDIVRAADYAFACHRFERSIRESHRAANELMRAVTVLNADAAMDRLSRHLDDMEAVYRVFRRLADRLAQGGEAVDMLEPELLQIDLCSLQELISRFDCDFLIFEAEIMMARSVLGAGMLQEAKSSVRSALIRLNSLGSLPDYLRELLP